MKIPETIEVNPISLRQQKIAEVLECKIELSDKALRYVSKFYADEANPEDEELPWQNVYTSFDITLAKDAVTCLACEFSPDQRQVDEEKKIDYWAVRIYAKGLARDIPIFFERELAAQDLYEKLQQYFFGITVNT